MYKALRRAHVLDIRVLDSRLWIWYLHCMSWGQDSAVAVVGSVAILSYLFQGHESGVTWGLFFRSRKHQNPSANL